jgi:hypothetical protein
VSLNQKQVEFMRTLAAFLSWCFARDIEVIGGELFRTPAQAEIYAEQGKGIRNSNHTKKLAIDLFRYKGGTVTWDTDDYQEMGQQWKSMHPMARWGGDFANRDAVHFSFWHQGVA